MENTREEYEIKDKKLEELVINIYDTAEQPYWDITAKCVSELIENYIKTRYNL
tara:strand:- start:590 stop:748 length:159 start_codon:yes stop_codon:yes gene_type:complete